MWRIHERANNLHDTVVERIRDNDFAGQVDRYPIRLGKIPGVAPIVGFNICCKKVALIVENLDSTVTGIGDYDLVVMRHGYIPGCVELSQDFLHELEIDPIKIQHLQSIVPGIDDNQVFEIVHHQSFSFRWSAVSTLPYNTSPGGRICVSVTCISRVILKPTSIHHFFTGGAVTVVFFVNFTMDIDAVLQCLIDSIDQGIGCFQP